MDTTRKKIERRAAEAHAERKKREDAVSRHADVFGERRRRTSRKKKGLFNGGGKNKTKGDAPTAHVELGPRPLVGRLVPGKCGGQRKTPPSLTKLSFGETFLSLSWGRMIMVVAFFPRL